MKILLFLEDKLINEFLLEPNTEYSVGRSSDCDIVLPAKNGISRTHLKLLLNEEEHLEVQLVSKLGELLFDNELVEGLQLKEGHEFFVRNFKFVLKNENLVQQEVSIADENLPSADDTPKESTNSLPLSSNTDSNDFEAQNSLTDSTHVTDNDGFSVTKKIPEDQLLTTAPNSNTDEDTVTALNSLTATLHIISSSGKPKKSYELEGSSWLMGRDKNCSLFLNYPFISRKHFEIIKTSEGYYIYDYGSSNGTSLNEKKLPKGEHIRLYNNDTISIKSLTLQIEIRDIKYREKIYQVESIQEASHSWENSFIENDIVSPRKRNKSILLMRVALALLTVTAIYGYKTKGHRKNRTIASNQKVIKKQNGLTKEKELLASDIYNMAKNNYTEKQFFSCLEEIERLHKIIPKFKNSQRMEVLCKQGLELEQEQKIKTEREAQAQEVEKKSNQIALNCQRKIKKFTNKSQLDNCLNSLLVLNPAHPMISNLENQWEQMELDKIQRVEQNKMKQQRLAQGQRLLLQAKQNKKRGQLKKSIQLYNQYLRGNYSHSNGQASMVKREISSLKGNLEKLSSQLMSICQDNFENKNYKDSYYSCLKVLNKFPENTQAEDIRTSSLENLRAKAKGLYADGALEESLGNISAARDKWNEILKVHIKTDEYYQKAKRKLDKYESLE